MASLKTAIIRLNYIYLVFGFLYLYLAVSSTIKLVLHDPAYDGWLVFEMWSIFIWIILEFFLVRSSLQDEDQKKLRRLGKGVLLCLIIQARVGVQMLENPQYYDRVVKIVCLNGLVTEIFIATTGLFVIGSQLLLAIFALVFARRLTCFKRVPAC